MIKNLIFDIAGIFITTEESATLVYYSKKLIIPLEKLQQTYDKYYQDYETGNLTDEEMAHSFFSELGTKVDPEYWNIRLGFKKRYPEMFEFVEKLGKKYAVYFISNEGKGYWERIDKKLGVSNMFNDGIVSYQVGVRKPDERIFEALIKKNNLIAKECVFIDDREKNLHGASKLGMKVVHYQNINQLKKDLSNLGIKVL